MFLHSKFLWCGSLWRCNINVFKHVSYRYVTYIYTYVFSSIGECTKPFKWLASDFWLSFATSGTPSPEPSNTARSWAKPAEKPIHGPVGPLCEFMKLQYNETQIHNERLLEIFANNFKSAVDLIKLPCFKQTLLNIFHQMKIDCSFDHDFFSLDFFSKPIKLLGI